MSQHEKLAFRLRKSSARSRQPVWSPAWQVDSHGSKVLACGAATPFERHLGGRYAAPSRRSGITVPLAVGSPINSAVGLATASAAARSTASAEWT